MATSGNFIFYDVNLSIRFVQGYRFLDRCGEALVRLEEVLDQGWIPTETSPKGGSMKNDAAGLATYFNSDSLVVQQTDYFDLSMFRDQASKIYSVLRESFKIERINVPSVRVLLQKGFDEFDLEKANEYFLSLNLCSVSDEIQNMIGGQKHALDFTLVTYDQADWSRERVRLRRRIAGSVIRQERRQGFDERLVKRIHLLPLREQQVIAALYKLRKQMPEIPPVAIQFDIEHSFEREFSAKLFDLPTFIDLCWHWASNVQTALDKLKPGIRQ